jgi:hypothetical protein
MLRSPKSEEVTEDCSKLKGQEGCSR